MMFVPNSFTQCRGRSQLRIADAKDVAGSENPEQQKPYVPEYKLRNPHENPCTEAKNARPHESKYDHHLKADDLGEL
jgi:hypothetical protein